MSLSVTNTDNLLITDTSGNPFAQAGDQTLTIGITEGETLNAGTTPAATKYVSMQKALSTGAASIDLTSLPDTAGNAGAVTFTGLKVLKAFLRNPSTNANSITVSFGASNPYNLFGASFVVVLAPGQSIKLHGNNATPTVGSGAKQIDLAGTGSQALDVILVAG